MDSALVFVVTGETGLPAQSSRGQTRRSHGCRAWERRCTRTRTGFSRMSSHVARLYTVQFGVEGTLPEIQSIFNRMGMGNDEVRRAVGIIAGIIPGVATGIIARVASRIAVIARVIAHIVLIGIRHIRAVVLGVGNSITIDVGIARIAHTIVIGIGLTRVAHVRTIVSAVIIPVRGNPIGVRVERIVLRTAVPVRAVPLRIRDPPGGPIARIGLGIVVDQIVPQFGTNRATVVQYIYIATMTSAGVIDSSLPGRLPIRVAGPVVVRARWGDMEHRIACTAPIAKIEQGHLFAITAPESLKLAVGCKTGRRVRG